MIATTATAVTSLVELAHSACSAGCRVPPAERAGWLEAVAAHLERHDDELVALAGEETHLPEGRLRGELSRTTFQLRLLAREVRAGQPLEATIDHADPDWGMGPRPDIRRMNVPLGVVAVFGASNFPFAFSVMGGDTASALAAGCAVVHKIHEAHERLGARTAALVEDALAGTSAPPGLFAAVTGRTAGEALVDHPLVKAVGFTGSARVGRMLFDRASARPEPIPFYGELGSTNPVFVTERAWATRSRQILEGFVGSFTLGMGQFCTKPGFLFVPRLDAAAADALRAALSESPRFPMLSASLTAGFAAALEKVGARTRTLVAGATGPVPGPSVFVTTLDELLRAPDLLGEEMFGPATVVVEYGRQDRLTHVARLLPGQLTAGIQGDAEDVPAELVAELERRAGRIVWNDWPTGVTVSFAQQHGGPYPATTAPATTSVGTAAVRRFLRPVAYQSFPDAQLPPALQDANPWQIGRRVDGRWIPAEGGSR